jgi:hypothetical protein
MSGSGILPGVLRISLASLAILLAMCGCAPASKLEGVWTMTSNTLADMQDSAKLVMQFQGKSLKIILRQPREGVGTLTIVGTGTFKLNGEDYVHVIDGAEFDTSEVNPIHRDAVSTAFDPAAFKKQMTERGVAKLKWISENEISITNDYGTMVLKRGQ